MAALLDQVIELRIAARNRRRIAANFVGQRGTDAGEPALELERELFDALDLDRAGPCLVRHGHGRLDGRGLKKKPRA